MSFLVNKEHKLHTTLNSRIREMYATDVLYGNATSLMTVGNSFYKITFVYVCVYVHATTWSGHTWVNNACPALVVVRSKVKS